MQPVVLAFVLVVCAAPGRGQDGSPEVLSLLARGDALGAEQLAQGMRRLPVEALPDLLSAFDGTFAGDGDPTRELLGAQRYLDAGGRQHVRDELVRRGRELVVPHLRASSKSNAAPREARLRQLSLLGDIGDGRDVALAVRFAVDPDPARPPHAALRRALEDVVARQLERDPRGCGRVRDLIAYERPEIAASLVRALQRSGRPEGLDALSHLIGFDASLDRLLVSGIGQLADRVPHPIPENVRSRVRALLSSDDPSLVAEVMLALGRLEDFESVEDLVAALGSPDRATRRNAHWALERMSGLRLPEQPEPWSAWLEAEARWYREEVPALRAQLRSPDPALSVAALNALTGRRFQRHRVALWIGECALDGPVEVRRTACAALGQLRSPAAAPILTLLLDDGDESIQQAAADALQRLPKFPVPSDDDSPESIRTSVR